MYKEKFEKEKGKSIYNHMIVPPDVQHAMDVAKNQSNVSHFHKWAKTVGVVGLGGNFFSFS